MIDIISHDNADDLISQTAAYLELNESEHSLPLGMMYGLAGSPLRDDDDPPLLVSIRDRRRVVGMAIMTQGRKLVLSRIDAGIEDAVERLICHLRTNDVSMPGVVGPSAEARAFSNGWAGTANGISSSLAMSMRVFEIREVAAVPLSEGELRPAGMDDHAVMTRWIAEFSEAIGETADFEAAARGATRYIQAEQLYIWDYEGPVSMAKTSHSTRNGININGVYTPAGHRNKGYATSCVWALTRELLSDRHSFCSLFTDLLNPTSNSIYTKIGYRPVGDALAFDFSSPDSGGPETSS